MSPRNPRFRRRSRRALRSSPATLLVLAAGAGLPGGAAHPSAAAGQDRPGFVSGQALTVDRAKPVPFTLVTLGDGVASGEALTDRDGRFEFRVVPAGDYRLRLERVGFRSDSGQLVHVAAGQSVQVTIHDLLQPLQLSPGDTAGGVCYPGSLLDRNATLSALWQEAHKAARARRALDLSYRYRVKLSEQVARYSGVWLSDPWRSRRTLESTPPAAAALAEAGGFAGYGVGMDTTRLVEVAEMLAVLEPEFLRADCLRLIPHRSGEWRLRFQPLNPDPLRTELIGNIVLDGEFRLRRIEFEYHTRGQAVARGRIEYGDGGLPGGQLRFLSSIRVETLEAPETEGYTIDLDAADTRAQRAVAYASYGKFVRDTALVGP